MHRRIGFSVGKSSRDILFCAMVVAFCLGGFGFPTYAQTTGTLRDDVGSMSSVQSQSPDEEPWSSDNDQENETGGDATEVEDVDSETDDGGKTAATADKETDAQIDRRSKDQPSKDSASADRSSQKQVSPSVVDDKTLNRASDRAESTRPLPSTDQVDKNDEPPRKIDDDGVDVESSDAKNQTSTPVDEEKDTAQAAQPDRLLWQTRYEAPPQLFDSAPGGCLGGIAGWAIGLVIVAIPTLMTLPCLLCPYTYSIPLLSCSGSVCMSGPAGCCGSVLGSSMASRKSQTPDWLPLAIGGFGVLGLLSTALAAGAFVASNPFANGTSGEQVLAVIGVTIVTTTSWVATGLLSTILLSIVAALQEHVSSDPDFEVEASLPNPVPNLRNTSVAQLDDGKKPARGNRSEVHRF